jgi:hypothetical protein
VIKRCGAIGKERRISAFPGPEQDVEVEQVDPEGSFRHIFGNCQGENGARWHSMKIA